MKNIVLIFMVLWGFEGVGQSIDSLKITTNQSILCNPNSVNLTVTGNVSDKNIAWQKNGQIIQGATNSSYLPNAPGVYSSKATMKGWISQTPNIPEVTLNDVFFADSLNGWVVGDYAYILNTTDGGKKWVKQFSNTDEYKLNSIYFIDKKNGWAVGSNNLILHTTDGGANWLVQLNFTEYYNTILWSIFFKDSLHGWAVGDKSKIYYTDNGGDTWTLQLQNENATDSFKSVFATTNQIVWAVSDAGKVWKSNNGGVTWNTVLTYSQSFSMYDIFFTDELNGWIPLSNLGIGTILHTTDGGVSWQTQTFTVTSTSYSFVSSIIFKNSLNGYLIGNNDIFSKTTDGGNTWTNVPSPSNRVLKSIFFTDNNNAWLIAGDYGTVFKTTNNCTSWSRNIEKLPFRDLGITFFIDLNIGYRFNTHENLLLKTYNGGSNWKIVSTFSNYPRKEITGLYFVNAQIGWVVGENGLIMKTIDGGLNWVTQNSGTSTQFQKIHFQDENNGWAVGNRNTYNPSPFQSDILHTTDGGSTWVTKGFNYNVDKYFVQFTSSNICTLLARVQGVPKLIITIDGGNTWSTKDSGIDYTYAYMNDAQNGWAVYTDNLNNGIRRLVKTSNGGDTWTQSVLTEITEMYFTDLQHGWAKSFDNIFQTNNGGTSWVQNASFPYSSVEGGASTINNSQFKFLSNLVSWYTTFGKIFRTTDGWLTWTVQKQENIDQYIKDVSFVDKNIGWLTINNYSGGLYKTVSGGKTWFSKELPFNDSFVKVFFKNNLEGILIGSEVIGQPDGYYYNKIYHTVDGGETWTISYTISLDYDNYEIYSSFRIKYENNLWLRLYRNICYYSSDGENWTLKVFSGNNAYTIDFLHGFYFTNAGLFYTADGGITYTTRNLPNIIPSNLRLKFINPQLGYLWGDDPNNSNTNICYKTLDGGNTWSIFSVVGRIFDIVFDNSSQYGLVIGYSTNSSPQLFKTIDGGQNWVSEKTNYKIYESSKIIMKDSANFWILNGLNLIKYSNDILNSNDILITNETNKTTTKSGNWNDPTVWSCGTVPNETQNVTIKTGHTITVLNTGGVQKCKNVSFETGGFLINNGGLKINLP